MITFAMSSIILIAQHLCLIGGIENSYKINQIIEFEISISQGKELKYLISLDAFVDHSFAEFKGDEGWEEFVNCIDFPQKKASKWHHLSDAKVGRHKYHLATIVDKHWLENKVNTYRIVVKRLTEKNKEEIVCVSKAFTITN